MTGQKDQASEKSILSIEQALDKVLGYIDVLDKIECPLLDSLGLVLAEDVISAIDVPSTSNAVMDGYAIRAKDSSSASRESPRILKVIGMVAAGARALCPVEPGTAIRIMTGAPVPNGADAVVRFEDTDEVEHRGVDKEIGIIKEAKPGLFIRKAGEDIAKGSRALAAGTVIRPPEIGVLASMGLSKVKVVRRPKVAVIATGDELAELDQTLPPGKIYNSNSYGVAASVLRWGGVPLILGIARDNKASLIEKLEQAADADIVVTSAGVSAGDYDMVKDVLAGMGEVVFATVRMKPGKPLAFGRLKLTNKNGIARNVPHLGLPGNRVLSMVASELFLRPAILKMLGWKSFTKPSVPAVMDEARGNESNTRVFNRAIVTRKEGVYHAKLTGPQGTGILTSMSRANGLAIIPEDRDRVKKGDIVQVMMLDWDDTVF